MMRWRTFRRCVKEKYGDLVNLTDPLCVGVGDFNYYQNGEIYKRAVKGTNLLFAYMYLEPIASNKSYEDFENFMEFTSKQH